MAMRYKDIKKHAVYWTIQRGELVPVKVGNAKWGDSEGNQFIRLANGRDLVYGSIDFFATERDALAALIPRQEVVG